MRRFLARLANIFTSRNTERELAREIASHLALLQDEFERRGLSPEEAKLAARRSYGGIGQAKELHREARSFIWIEQWLKDLRYGARNLLRTPGLTAVAVITLALGIGANTAIFSLVHAVILKPLPYRDPSRLIAIWDTYLPLFPKLGVSAPEREALQQQADLFEQTAWYRYVPKNFNLIVPGSAADQIHATFISAGLFPLLGVAPSLGRAFTEDEPSQSVLLSHQLWRSRFGGSPDILGQAIRLDDETFAVVGVMPPDFQFPEGADIWLPRGPLLGDELTNPIRHSLGLVARLRPGITHEQVRVRLETIYRNLTTEHPRTSTGFGFQVSGLQDDLNAQSRPALILLWGAVVLVLLIACGNVANLLLSRASGRTKEIAIRVALGARIGRIVRQLLTESLMLAAVGGAIGFALAAWSLAALAPVKAPIDAVVFLFLIAVSTGSGIVFGLAPVLQALKIDPISAIKPGPIGGESSASRSAVVILEFALALVVVVGAGILAKSFFRLMHVDPGFTAHGLLTLRISWPPSQNAEALFARIRERLESSPGIESIAAANTLPLVADRANALRFNVPGSPLIDPDALPVGQIRAVSPGYFRAMQIPFRSGRSFTEQELGQSVVVINESMARRFWPGQDPVGAKFVTAPWAPNPGWSTIVGVAGDVKQFGLDSEPSMDIYFPSLAPAYLILRTSADASTLAAAVQREIQAMNPDLAISDVRTMDQVMEQSASSRRWTMGLLSAFAGLALILALIGIYGVTSWAVSQRTREIGIRMALGADAGEVRRMVIGYGTRLCVTGLAIGIAGSLALRGFLASLAFEVSTADPFIYGGAVLLMILAALLACYLPARRASRVDPLVALRWE